MIGNSLKLSPSFPPPSAGRAIFTAPSGSPIRLLSSFGFRRATPSRALLAYRFRSVEFFAELQDFLFDFRVNIHWRVIAVDSLVTVTAYPRKIRNLVDFVHRQAAIYMMTMSVFPIGQISAATSAFAFVTVKGVLTIHEILEIVRGAFHAGNA